MAEKHSTTITKRDARLLEGAAPYELRVDGRRISSMMPSIKSDLGKVIRELGKISINLTSLHNELTGVSRGGCANPKICEVADRRGAGQH